MSLLQRVRRVRAVWLCLAALGCAQGDVSEADADPMADASADGGFTGPPPPRSLDAAFRRGPERTTDAGQADLRIEDPPPPPA